MLATSLLCRNRFFNSSDNAEAIILFLITEQIDWMDTINKSYMQIPAGVMVN